MLIMISESFVHALLLCLGLFLKISRWVPCVLGSFGVVLMSCIVNFHVVRSALQYFAYGA